MTLSRIRPAFVVWVLAMLVLVLSGWILLPFPRRPTGWEQIVWALGSGVGFTTVGALLVDRRPRESVSRITFGVGLMVVAAIGLRASAVWLEAQPGDVPPVVGVAAVLSQALTTLAFLAAGGFLLVRFPDGRHRDALSAAVDVLVVLISGAVLVQLFAPGPIDVDWISTMDNPIGIEALGPVVEPWFGAAGLVLYATSLVLAVLEVISRYRRADPVVRAQIRWVAAAGAVPLALVPFIIAAEWLWSLWFVSTMLLPLAIGVALLRYRLFDIDRIVGRTIAYAIVTAILAGVFVVVNLALVAVFADATRSNTLVVAASTLLVATLFQPIRRRVQVPVDRRFNRARVDAEVTTTAFAERLRDVVEIDAVTIALRRTIDDSVTPSTQGIWLRGAVE
jgi:hypothetical protein